MASRPQLFAEGIYNGILKYFGLLWINLEKAIARSFNLLYNFVDNYFGDE